MKERKYTDGIPQILRGYLKEGESLVNLLMSILLIGKESAYRRIRGEIPFSFEEIAQLSAALGFSIDTLVGMRSSNYALFSSDLLHDFNRSDIHLSRIEWLSGIIKRMLDREDASITVITNDLPHMMVLKYRSLSRFILYKWVYQVESINPHFALSDFEVSQRLVAAAAMLHKEIADVASMEIILAPNLLSSISTDLKFFRQRDLITERQLTDVKNDLLQMVNNLEQAAVKGKMEGANSKTNVYLSSLACNGIYFMFNVSPTESHSLVQVQSLNLLGSNDERINWAQANWIRSYKRYSLNVTQSAEVERYIFFNGLRKEIAEIN